MTETNTETGFEPITSQEQLDRIISKRLRGEKDLEAELKAKDEEIANLKREHSQTVRKMSLETELHKRGIRDETRAARIKKLVDLEGDVDVDAQLDALASDVPELFKLPKGAGSGGSSKPVLPREEPLTRGEIENMSPEELNRPGIRERVDAFLRGER